MTSAAEDEGDDAELAAAIDAVFAGYQKEDFLGVGRDPARKAAYDAAVREACDRPSVSTPLPEVCTLHLARLFAPRPGVLDLRKRAKTLDKESLADGHARRVAERVLGILEGKFAFACTHRSRDRAKETCILTIDSDALEKSYFAFYRATVFSVQGFCSHHKITESELLNSPMYGVADSCVACNHRRPAPLKAFFAADDCFQVYHLLRDGSYVSRTGFRSIALFDANGKSAHPGWKFESDWKTDAKNPHARAYRKASSSELPLLLQLRRHGDVCRATRCLVRDVCESAEPFLI